MSTSPHSSELPPSQSDNLTYRNRCPIQRVSAYTGRLAPQCVPEHAHPEIQFVLGWDTHAIEATWHSEYGQRGRNTLHPGEIAIIPSDQPHSFTWHTPAIVSSVYVMPNQLEALHEIRPGAPHTWITPCYGHHDPLMRELIIALSYEACQNFPHGQLYAETLEQSLLLAAIRQHATHSVTERSPAHLPPHRFRAVIAYIEQHFTEDVSLADLANVAGASRFHFARAFKRATGLSPYHYLLDRRIREAKHLLATDMPLATMATTLGFADQGHFTTRFRSIVGITPAVFRKTRS